MRKKLYKFVSVAVIAVAMTVSFQMSKADNSTVLSLKSVISSALASGGEGNIPSLCGFAADGVCCETGSSCYCLPD